MIVKMVGDRCPVFYVKQENSTLNILLDTGSPMSVFNRSVDVLSDIFPDCKDTEKTTVLYSVNGSAGKLPVYSIPIVKLDELSIFNLPVAVMRNSKFPCELILSSWVFSKVKFAIDYENRILELSNLNRPIYCGLNPEQPDCDTTNFFTFACDNVNFDVHKSTHNLSKELKWCRAHAPEAIKDLPDEELWDIMKGSYYAAEGL